MILSGTHGGLIVREIPSILSMTLKSHIVNIHLSFISTVCTVTFIIIKIKTSLRNMKLLILWACLIPFAGMDANVEENAQNGKDQSSSNEATFTCSFNSYGERYHS